MSRAASLDEPRRAAARIRAQRIRRGACLWCGRRVRREPGKRGPLPLSCRSCRKRADLRRRMRAYLRSARRYALRLRRRELADAIAAVIATLDIRTQAR